MRVRLSAPSKTFLSGEYAVLLGGPALIFNSHPRFELQATNLPEPAALGLDGVRVGDTGVVFGISPDSPAGKWLEQRSPLLNNWLLEFIDPHRGAGGFGASGAQFVLVHAFTTFLQSSVGRVRENLDLKALWVDHQVLSSSKGSGADVLSQSVGGVAEVTVHSDPQGNITMLRSESKPWPFRDLRLLVVRTGRKVITHEHLEQIHTTPLERMYAPAEDCVMAFHQGESSTFVEAIAAYAEHLEEWGLQINTSIDLLNQVRTQDWCRAAKGCGALGADTLMALIRPEDEVRARQFFAELKLAVVASDSDICSGLEIDWKIQPTQQDLSP